MMKKSSKAQALVLPFLPDEIITDILIRLPVKTLVRFRFVSKSWLNLISNPNFINTHLLNISKSITFYQQKIAYLCKRISDGHRTDSYYLKSYSLHSPFDDDYKVVQMEFDSSSRKKVVKLYSLRTNSWKKISDFPYSGASSHRDEFVNGALHWQVWNSGRNFTSFVIVSLDLGNETYGEIAQPDYGSENCSSSLIVVEGCISLYYKFTGRADIWVMKEYGLRDSWVKLYTISYTQVPKVPMGNGYVKYLSSNSMTGEILLKCNEMLLIYHTKYGNF